MFLSLLLFIAPSVCLSKGVCPGEMTNNTSPSVVVDCYPTLPHKPSANEERCLAQGCCWDDMNDPPCQFPFIRDAGPTKQDDDDSISLSRSSTPQCSSLQYSERMHCRNPRYNPVMEDINQPDCEAIGCCYDDKQDISVHIPRCYQPQTNGYEMKQLNQTRRGWLAFLKLDDQLRGPYGNDIPRLLLNVTLETSTRLRVRITDAQNERYEVNQTLKREEPVNADTSFLYNFTFTQSPCGFAVTRVDTGVVLFNTTPPVGRSYNGLIYENQFLQLTTSLTQRSDHSPSWIYGMGEQIGYPWLETGSPEGEHYTFFSRDQLAALAHHTAEGGQNIYGVHPFYVHMEHEGGKHKGENGLSGAHSNAHGVFFLNSNAMETVLSANTLTYRSTGGILDITFFLGPSPVEVVQQYTSAIGRPRLPPYWALGFHLCRWGYKTLNNTRSYVERMREAGMPQDSQWHDIDYMDSHLDFTVDPVRFPAPAMEDFVKDLHAHGQNYVVIIDPGIATEVKPTGSHAYEALDSGLADGVFIKASDGKSNLEGKVWPGYVHFPDFSHPNASRWWHRQLAQFHSVVPFDGAWIDMNEPSNFCDGQKPFCYDGDGNLPNEPLNAQNTNPFTASAKDGITYPFDPYRQPYVPGQISSFGGKGNLDSRTVSMASHHYAGLHYNLHSMYGNEETKTTHEALERIRGKRSLVVSRSTFAGSGHYGAHWLGDNNSSWTNLKDSIAGIIHMSMFGIPFVGADICGFEGNATAELCVRWHQLGAFYPFARNHNHILASPQAPVDFDNSTQDLIRNALLTRYLFLPHLYTLLAKAEMAGEPVIRPLVFEFPDARAAFVDSQFLWGSDLMISPALEEGERIVTAYFPDDYWYDYWSGCQVNQHHEIPGTVKLDAPMDKLNLHLRAGSIIPTQQPALTTQEARRKPFGLLVALPNVIGNQPALLARGSLFVDDGESIVTIESKTYSLIEFSMRRERDGGFAIESQILMHGYKGPEMHVPLDSIVMYAPAGLFDGTTFRIGGRMVKHVYSNSSGLLKLVGLGSPIGKPLRVLGKPILSSSNSSNDSRRLWLLLLCLAPAPSLAVLLAAFLWWKKQHKPQAPRDQKEAYEAVLREVV